MFSELYRSETIKLTHDYKTSLNLLFNACQAVGAKGEWMTEVKENGDFELDWAPQGKGRLIFNYVVKGKVKAEGNGSEIEATMFPAKYQREALIIPAMLALVSACWLLFGIFKSPEFFRMGFPYVGLAFCGTAIAWVRFITLPRSRKKYHEFFCSTFKLQGELG